MPFDILTILQDILNRYGVNTVMFCIICYLIWKLGSNHLFHIHQDVKSCAKKIDTLSEDFKSSNEKTNTKIDNLEKEIADSGERISKIEGKIGIE